MLAAVALVETVAETVAVVIDAIRVARQLHLAGLVDARHLAAAQEARRCYLCYLRFEIDIDNCIYCRACIEVAPRNCIKLVSAIEIREDGSYLYTLPSVVDDIDMGVTHVIRGDDHLNNAARQTIVYQAMGWDLPVWAHIPLIHGPDGKKLSKRHGALAAADGVVLDRDEPPPPAVSPPPWRPTACPTSSAWVWSG